MDNLTHSLIGLVAGEVVARATRPRSGGLADPARRRSLLVMGIVGGNLPDVDLLWSLPAVTGDRLAYLVEHRGYTHTLVGCAALGLLLFLGTLAALAWRGHRIRARDACLLASMAQLAVMLHLGMDALNEYGVHPFWPWNNRWYYGDAMFIVEPLCWLALAPLYFSLQTSGARVFVGMALVAGCIAVLAFHRFGVAWWGLPLLTLLLLLVGRRLTPRAASLLAAGLLLAVVGTFLLTHALAIERVRTLAASLFPGAGTLDIVLSPAPAHPFCWEVLLLQREGRRYVARAGQLSLAAGNGSGACARSIGDSGTAPLMASQAPPAPGMHWAGEFSMDAGALARLAAANCDTRRLASFLRAPFAAETPRGWMLGDLRYDREPGPGFSELLVDSRGPGGCRKSSPWIPPRGDLGF